MCTTDVGSCIPNHNRPAIRERPLSKLGLAAHL
ncbi:Uncharacterised protein [Afipia felis]|uniref:Uncharacterized protein n=2 Tax=Afipia felis TaxID=1035 RepID=A0A380WCK1_AFIFE|nr:hypothetical protein HMPREF9697_02292 [Afipia felis ATCC 53690]SUU78471.1 Uncharacterised protein [Afipia felis]SUU86536.1 Uncharacterised protein [Afipia felis]